MSRMHSSGLGEDAVVESKIMDRPSVCLWMYTRYFREWLCIVLLSTAGEEDCARVCGRKRWPT